MDLGIKRAWNFADALDICALIATLSSLFAYPLLWPPHLVQLDDMADWGMKGPGTSSLSKNMRGVYYLSGSKQTSRCNATERHDPSLCLDGYHRPLAFGLDTSYCKCQYHYTTSHQYHYLTSQVVYPVPPCVPRHCPWHYQRETQIDSSPIFHPRVPSVLS